MRPPLLLLLVACVLVAHAGEPCPPGCYCDEKKSELVAGGLGLKINCHQLASGHMMDFSLLPSNTIHLDLAKYGLKAVPADAFAKTPFLQKLDLQNNDIMRLDEAAFRNLPHLEVLDLSQNRLEWLGKRHLAGLNKLKRLKLNDNRIQTIEAGSFDQLDNLMMLELADNSFVCNCSLKWLLEWSSSRPHILGTANRIKCALPIHLADVLIRDANPKDFVCSDSSQRHVGIFQIKPSEHQVVFEGDSIKLSCKVRLSSTQKIGWMVKGKMLDREADGISLWTGTLPDQEIESFVEVKRLKAGHSGDWTCAVMSPEEESVLVQKSVNLLVITSDTSLCYPSVSETPHGTYKWGVAVGGHTVQQVCERSRQGPGFGFAYYLCRQGGEWASTVNTSQCAYTSPVTETLMKFATMNTSFDQSTLLESAKHFLNYTSSPEIFQDPLDLVYFSQAVENYLPYMRRNGDVGHYMMDMISKVQGVRDPDLLLKAQMRGMACKRLIQVIENVTSVLPTFKHHGHTLAVEVHALRQLHFDALACTWYSTDTAGMVTEYQRFSPRRVFHCAKTNKTVPTPGKKVLSSVMIPANLEQQITSAGLVNLLSGNHQLLFSTFFNASLFPSPISPDFERPVGATVAGCTLLGAPVFNLTDRVYVVLHSDQSLDDTAAGSVQPVWWDPYLNAGLGGWNAKYCQLINVKSQLIWFSCSRLGFYSYRLARKRPGSATSSAIVFRHHHPLIYASASLCLAALIGCTLVYLTCYSSIEMSRKLKHTLPNMWVSMSCLLFLFTIGIYQTQHQVICRTVGLLTHLLTLSSVVWMTVFSHIVYKKVTQRQQIRLRLQRDPAAAHPAQRPLARLYLAGWGLSMVIVAFTAAINVDFYGTENHCFLKTAPFLGALVLPTALLLSVVLGFSLSAYCVVSTVPMHVTEQVEVHALPPTLSSGSRRIGCGSSTRSSQGGSLLSIATVLLPDEEKSTKAVLAGHLVFLLLFLTSWALAAVSVVMPLLVGHSYDDVMAVSSGLLLLALGVFAFAFYCASRSDVRRCWRKPKCLASSSGKRLAASVMQHTGLEQHPERVQLMLHANTASATHFGAEQTKLFLGAQSEPLPFTSAAPHAADVRFMTSAAMPETGGNCKQQQQQQLPQPLTRKESDDLSSDHMSVNNLNHLRRGYVAPVNSAGVSETDYTLLPQLLAGCGVTAKMAMEPKTSSPATSGLPAFMDQEISPLIATNHCHSLHGPYSVVSLDDLLIKSGQDLALKRGFQLQLESVNEALDYTESCTIRAGEPCQLATTSLPTPADKEHRARKSGSSTNGKSLSRRHVRTKKHHSDDPDRDEVRSKHSVGSSTCYSNRTRSSNSANRKRHKRPNRRRPRVQPKEDPQTQAGSPSSQAMRQREDSLEDNYLGDQDQDDSLERRPARSESSRCPLPPMLMGQQPSQLTAADLPKRETSV